MLLHQFLFMFFKQKNIFLYFQGIKKLILLNKMIAYVYITFTYLFKMRDLHDAACCNIFTKFKMKICYLCLNGILF